MELTAAARYLGALIRGRSSSARPRMEALARLIRFTHDAALGHASLHEGYRDIPPALTVESEMCRSLGG